MYCMPAAYRVHRYDNYMTTIDLRDVSRRGGYNPSAMTVT